MPFVAGIIGAIAGPILGLGAIGTAILGTIVSVGLGFIARLIAPKPKAPTMPDFTAPLQDRTQMVRQPISKRRFVVGEVKIGGILTYLDSSENGKDWRMVVTLCDGPVQAIPVVWFNDQPIYADQINQTTGLVTSGPFANKATITKYLGENPQAQNPNLPTGFFGHGVAYLDCLINWNADTYPGGLPSIGAEVQGMKFVDPRDADSPPVERFTMNAAVVARGLLGGGGWWGAGYGEDALPDSWFNAAANTCDEYVATADVIHEVSSVVPATGTFRLKGDKLELQTADRVQVVSSGSVPTGTPDPAYVIVKRSRNRTAAPKWEVGIDDDTAAEKIEIKLAASAADALAGNAATITTAGSGNIVVNKTGEPRYAVSGLFSSDTGWLAQLEQIVTAMAGRAVYAGGEWRVRAGAYVAPDVEIGPGDVHGPVKIHTRIPRRDRFNSVGGTYFSPLNDWQPADYPAVSSDAYEAEDGESIPRQPYDLPLTTRSNCAQRLASIELQRTRGNEISVEFSALSLKGLRIQAGDNIKLTLPEYGWSEKPFEVQTFGLAVEEQDGKASLIVPVTVRETSSAIYTFGASDETPVKPIARSRMASAFYVPAPTTLYARTLPVASDQADIVFTAILSWALVDHGLVSERGRFEIQAQRAPGRALQFDGGDDFVSFGQIDLENAADSFGVLIYAKPNDTTPALEGGLWTNGQLSILQRTDGKVEARLDLGSPITVLTSTDSLPQDVWTDVAVVREGDYLALYFDAALQDDATVSGAMPAPLANAQLGRGKDATANTAYFGGALDDVRIYKNYAPTEDDLALALTDPLTGREDYLAGYWSMDLAVPDQLLDGTINGNSGSISGAAFADGAISGQWQPSWIVDGQQRSTALPMLEAGATYNIRIRAVSVVGVRSAWSVLEGFAVGGAAGASSLEDWGSIADAPDSPGTDWGAITDTALEGEDWGSVV